MRFAAAQISLLCWSVILRSSLPNLLHVKGPTMLIAIDLSQLPEKTVTLKNDDDVQVLYTFGKDFQILRSIMNRH